MSNADKKILDPKMTELLVCPLTKGPLRMTEDGNGLHSPNAKLVYPIRDGIPILLPSEAMPVDEA